MGKILLDGRYELRGLLGSGGMADVYLAHDNILDRDVVLKLLKDRYAEDEEFVERFRREARSAASLFHPYIVPVFDCGETDDGMYCIAMEYLPGGTLKDEIMSKGALPVRMAADVALQIAEALRAAHERDLIHRDIKPGKILITDTGHVKVTDFGIARAAETTTSSDLGDILGTAKYMSPEQAMGKPVGPASDLYSLGVMLYEMLTASVPFEVETPAEVSAKHAGGPPPLPPRELNLEVPEGMDALVMRLLSSDPADRYGSATELIEDLRQLRNGLSTVVSSGDDATTASLETPTVPTLATPAPGDTGLSWRKWVLIVAAFVLLAPLSAAGAAGWNPLRDSGAASVIETLRGAPEGLSMGAATKPSSPDEVNVSGVEDSTGQKSRERAADAGGALAESGSGGKRAENVSNAHFTVGQTSEVARVPDLVGLSYPEAEYRLEEAGFLLGGVKEAPSDTVPEGVIMNQEPLTGTTLDPGAYVYLTTSVGSPDTSEPDGRQASSVTGSQHHPLSEQEAVAAAVQGHYAAIGEGDFQEAYSYFGPTMRSQHDETNWIEGEQSYDIQGSTIHFLTIDEVSGTTATATVDVSFVDNTGMPRFLIVWSLVKKGHWKLDAQISAQEETEGQPDSSSTPAATPTASPSASLAPSSADVSPVREEREPLRHLVKVSQSSIYHGVDSLQRRYHPEGLTSVADAQYTN